MKMFFTKIVTGRLLDCLDWVVKNTHLAVKYVHNPLIFNEILRGTIF